MTQSKQGLHALAAGAIENPFARLRSLLDEIVPGQEPVIDLTLGEPREAMPAFVGEEIIKAEALFAKYPSIKGDAALREAIAGWLSRRYALRDGVDLEREILPCNGSREGLFYACLPAVGRKTVAGRPAVLMCNPYYAAYIGAALATGAEPYFLNATQETDFLPDLDALEANTPLLERAAAFYLCSPSNPQGAVASADYILRALKLARAYDFMLFVDECYSEIYWRDPPVSGLVVAAATPERFQNIVVFNSLSKRSNVPGLRSGFCAGHKRFIAKLLDVRNLIGPQMPGPVQHASAALWKDEQHVDANREAYRNKFDVADDILNGRFGYQRPAGGFFLWLDMQDFGSGGEAAVTLLKRVGVKILPGAFLAQTTPEGINPGETYVRMALVHDNRTVQEALERIVNVNA